MTTNIKSKIGPIHHLGEEPQAGRPVKIVVKRSGYNQLIPAYKKEHQWYDARTDELIAGEIDMLAVGWIYDTLSGEKQ